MKSAINSPKSINSPQKRHQAPCLGQSQQSEGRSRSRGRISKSGTIRSLKTGKLIPCDRCGEVRVLQERCTCCGSIREQKPEAAPYLQIQSVPVAQRLNPRKNAYTLVILPHGIRPAAGQYTPGEAYEIAKAVRGWDWALDPDGRPYCLPELEALLDSICKRSALKGGER